MIRISHRPAVAGALLKPLGIALLLAMPQLLQAADESSVEVVAAEAEPTLGKVTVTARRRSEDAQTVPKTITALRGTDMESQKV